MKHKFIICVALVLSIVLFLFVACKEGDTPNSEPILDANGDAAGMESPVYEETGTRETYPWEDGGKKPDEYTWQEFQSLSLLGQEAFFEWFESPKAFEMWMDGAKPEESEVETVPQETESRETYPWENGSKQPNEYSWEEFWALSNQEQEAFFEWFETPEEFEKWMNTVNPEETQNTETLPKEPDDEETKPEDWGDAAAYPWENGGKQPGEYTWEEYQALSEQEQEAFFEWFGSSRAFEIWLEAVKPEDPEGEETQTGTSGSPEVPSTDPDNAENYPWENGGKRPDQYTWEEFLALSELEQEAFFEWFETPEGFEAWMNRVMPDES